MNIEGLKKLGKKKKYPERIAKHLREGRYISMTRLAREFGLSRRTVFKKVKDGVIKKVKETATESLVSFEQGRRALIMGTTKENYYSPESIVNRRVKKGHLKSEDAPTELKNRMAEDLSRNPGKAPVPIKKKDLPEELSEEELNESMQDAFTSKEKKNQAEADTKLYQAKLAKIKYLKEIAALVDAQKTVEIWKNVALIVKKAILAVPDRTAMIFASTKNPEEIRKTMVTELTFALNKLKFNIADVNPDVDKYEVDEEA